MPHDNIRRLVSEGDFGHDYLAVSELKIIYNLTEQEMPEEVIARVIVTNRHNYDRENKRR